MNINTKWWIWCCYGKHNIFFCVTIYFKMKLSLSTKKITPNLCLSFFHSYWTWSLIVLFLNICWVVFQMDLYFIGILAFFLCIYYDFWRIWKWSVVNYRIYRNNIITFSTLVNRQRWSRNYIFWLNLQLILYLCAFYDAIDQFQSLTGILALRELCHMQYYTKNYWFYFYNRWHLSTCQMMIVKRLSINSTSNG